MLLEIAGSRTGHTASEIAQIFGLAVPTAYHLLTTLESERLLTKGKDKRYVLGSAATEIANAPGLRPTPLPQHIAALHLLAQRTQETAYLTGWFRGEIRIIATVEGSHAVRVAGLTVGVTKNVHARASAKLLLAYSNSELRNEVLEGIEYTPLTQHTVTSRHELEADLIRITQDGLVRDLGEYHADVCSLSMPLKTQGKVVAALAVVVPRHRFTDTESSLIATLAEVSSNIE